VEGDDPNNAGPYTELVYTITRSSNAAAMGQASTVDWILSKTSGSAMALDAADVWGGALSGRAEFAAGETSVQVTVKVIGDGLDEGDSTWRMALNTANGGGEAVQATAQTTVIDDDSTVSVSALQGLTVATEAPVEGNLAPSVQSYYYNVTRSGSSLGVATVSWQVGEAGEHSVNESDIRQHLAVDKRSARADHFGRASRSKHAVCEWFCDLRRWRYGCTSDRGVSET
jgi:hypothetical protein